MSLLKALLKHVVEEHGTLTQEQGCSAVREILEGEATDVQIAALLTAIAQRGPTVEELAGFVQAMRAMSVPLPLTAAERDQLVDTCGTGSDGHGTFNISTAAALVGAAAGVKIAKHGNRGVTSKCGSADVLEALGIPVALEPERAVECLRQTGFMFLYAPAMHPAMKRVQPVRRALGFRTIFNLAGPLANPAGARAQVIGVFAGLDLVAQSLARLGVRHAFVVRGRDGLDELTLNGVTDIAEVREHTVHHFTLEAADAGLAQAPLSALAGCDAAGNAALIERILHGEPGPSRDVVLLNAAAALLIAGLASDFPGAVRYAADAIDSGAGLRLLAQLREFAGQENTREIRAKASAEALETAPPGRQKAT
ncbi:MAG: anthranilate phosphoribosyltransferase [Acidobacteriaceae bacterium]